MVIHKAEILGTKIEINYEKKDHKKLLNLIEIFKKRISEFPNNGRTDAKTIIFLAALKAEDQIEEIKKEINKNLIDKKNLAEQKLIIENLKKEIFELKDDINEINLINKSSDNKKYFEEINILEKTIKSIQQKIKESIK